MKGILEKFIFRGKRYMELLRCLPLKVRCKVGNEVYFDKYDVSGAYHWNYYYNVKEPFYTAYVDAVCDLIPEGSRVLDIGCGDGLIANTLSEKKGATVFGVDVHPKAVALARKLNRNENTFRVQSAYDLKFSEEFDAVVAVEIVEHISKPELLIKNAARALKRAGHLVTSTPLRHPVREISKYHLTEYTKDEFFHFLEPDFRVVEERYIERPDGLSNCFIVKCYKV